MKITLDVSDKIPLKEYTDPKFLQLMINHMIFAHHKYHSTRKTLLSEQHKKGELKDKVIPNLYVRLDKYAETGNTEWLVDVANIAMIEYMFPSHPKAHFRPTSSEESPGIGEEN